MNAKTISKRERLKKWPLVTMLLLFVTLIVVGFFRSPRILALWMAVWGTYGVVRLALWAIKRLRETRPN